MIDYTSRKATQLKKQYKMLLESLKYTTDIAEKNNTYYELNKIEQSILDTTEEIYNEEYYKLVDKSTSLLKEEKDRLLSLIELIENRRKYIQEEVEKHKANVYIEFSTPKVLGQDQIPDFQKKIKIIDKYRQNIRLKDKLIKEIDILKDSIQKSDSKIKSNDKINKELETKMIEMLEKSFKALEIYTYKEREEEIELAFTELTYAKDKAVQNIEAARNANNTTLILECEKMLDSVLEEYNKYLEKKMLLKLLYMYDKVTSNYKELLNKREEINNILSQIDNSDFYKLVCTELNKQYTTIKLEQQDLKTHDSLISEKESKSRLLNEIEEENNSDEFANILNDLIKNEKIKHEKELVEKRKKEYEERQQKLIEDSKKQEEIRKKQKQIEEERKRDIEIRTKELLEAKQNKVITPKPKEKEIIPSEVEANNDAREKFVDKILNEIDDNDKTLESAPNNEFKEFSFFGETEEETKNEKISVVNSEFTDYDSILKDNNQEEFFKEEENNEFSIPVIKNDKLVSKKVDTAKVDENDIEEFMKKFLDDNKKNDKMEVNDMVFPDMPV